MMRLDSRTSLYCHEYLHKRNAPNLFDLTNTVEDDEIAKERKRMGDLHEAKVVDAIKASGLKVIHIDIEKAVEDRQVETAKALLNLETDVILGATIDAVCEAELERKIGGLCKGDPDRTSRPDVLFKTGERDGIPLWSPVDIKSHKAFDPKNQSNQVYVANLSEPASIESITGRIALEDAMQLTHYLVQLRALGLSADGSRAGIIGIDGEKIAWVDLDQTTFGAGTTAESALTRYHRSFKEAQDIIAQSISRAKDPSLPKPAISELVPGKFGCLECTFRDICMAELLAYDNREGHVTLLATVTPLEREKNFPDIHSIRALREAKGLNDFGIKSQLRAEVWKHGNPTLLDPNTPLDLPEFDIEIDIDLENSMEALIDRDPLMAAGNDRVYLYGYGIHDRTIDKDWRTAQLGSIFNYDDSDEGEYQVLLDTWNLLNDEVSKAEAAGKSVGIFHYSPHERTWWRNFAKRHHGKPGVPSESGIDTFTSQYFVDLYRYTQKISFPTISFSIKILAPHAGFKWEFDDAGGAMSLLKYKTAIDQSRTDKERDEAKEWLRRYNLDDIRATYAVRNYIRQLSL